jgi:hypothetical protein
MSGIFGAAFLMGSKIDKTNFNRIITELIRAQLGQTESISLVATSEDSLNVVQKDMDLAKFLASPTYKQYLDKVSNTSSLYSIVGSFRRRSVGFSTSPKTSIVTKIGHTMCVHKEWPSVNTAEHGGKFATQIIDEEMSQEVTSFYCMLNDIKKKTAKLCTYAFVNALAPSLLVVTQHTTDPIYISTFPEVGIMLFAPYKNTIINLGQSLELGRENVIEMVASTALVLCMKNNTSKMVKLFQGVS